MDNKKVALVLSGGGAQGAYEIGAWKALRKLKFKFDLVTGTSVGALNGIMVVQNDFYKAYKIWKNISFKDIYDTDIKEDVTLKKFYQKYGKEIIKNGGMKPDNLEKLLNLMFDAQKFYSSNIDYGLVTFNLSNLKVEYKTKKDLPKEKLTNYAIASATCFPAFKIKTINNKKYIDGGYYDNLPINLAIDMHATDIIAIDLEAIGIKRKIKKSNCNITIIKPHNKLFNILDFEKEKVRIMIKYGYNDTMKKYGKLEGNKYTFRKDNLKLTYLKYHEKLEKELNQVNLIDTKITENKFNKILEDNAEIFMLPDYNIYKIKVFNKKMLKYLNETSEIDNFPDFIKNKNLNNLFDRRKIVKTIYNHLIKDNSDLKLSLVANLFPREYIAALYLKIISKK